MDDGHVDKRTKKCVIKQKIKFEDYKNCLENTMITTKVHD